MTDPKLLQAQSLLRKGKYEDALSLYQEWITNEPEDATLYQNMAIILGELKRYSESLEMSAKALDLDPNLTMPHITMAYIYDTLGDQVRSRKEANIAVEKDPQLPEALCCAGILALKDNKLDIAKQFLEKTIRISPSFFWAHYNLAAIYQLQKDSRRLVREIVILFRLKPNIHNFFRLIYVALRMYKIASVLVIVLSIFLSFALGAGVILLSAFLLMVLWFAGAVFIGFMAEHRSIKQLVVNLFIGTAIAIVGLILFVWIELLASI